MNFSRLLVTRHLSLVTRLLVYSSLVYLFTACSSDLEKAEYDPARAVPAVLNPVGETYVLKPANATDTVFTLEWTKPDMRLDTKLINNVELDFAGNNFAGKATIATTAANGQSAAFTVSALNDKIIQLMAEDAEFKAYDFEIRIASTISPAAVPVYSNAVKTTITPYMSERKYPRIALRGGYADLMWGYEPSQFLYSPEETDTYTGWIIFDQGQAATGWKLCEDPDWQMQWGSTNTVMNTTPLTLETGANPANIMCYDQYGYKFSFNKTSAELAILYTVESFGIHAVGSNEADTKFNLLNNETDEEGNYQWYLRADFNPASDTQVIIRLNDSNEVTFGLGAKGKWIENGGESLTIPAGRYRIYFYFNKVEPYYRLVER